MSDFAILRHSKITTKAKLVMAVGHNRRTIPVPTAGAGTNKYYGAKDPVKKFDEVCNKYNIKPRANAVLAYELLMTYSPEKFGKIDNKEFLKKAKEFLEKEFPKEAILSIDMHFDETTPHIHAIVMPLIEKTVRGKTMMRLSAKDYTGEPKMLRDRQTRFAAIMEPLGLRRGTPHSKTKHEDIQTFYTRLRGDLEAANKQAADIFALIPKNPSVMDFFNIKTIVQKLQGAAEAFSIFAQKTIDLEKKNKALEEKNKQLTAKNARLNKQAITSDVFTHQKIQELVLQSEKQHQATLAAQYSTPVIEPAPTATKAVYGAPMQPSKHQADEDSLKK